MKTIKRALILDAGGPGGMAALQIIKKTLPDIVVTACDMDEYAPARVLADCFVRVLPADDPGYANNIREIIEQHGIDLVVPSFHFGHQALAELKSKVFVNNFEASSICQDKFKFYEWATKHGYKVPTTQLLSMTDNIESRVYIKPRFGAGSANNYTATNNKEFQLLKELLAGGQDYLVQEFIEGELWQVEALNLDGEMISGVTCQSLRVKAGNTIAALVSDYEELRETAKEILEDLRYNGLSNLEAIRTKRGELVIIEINARSGSCIQYTTEAGSNTIAFLLTKNRKYLAPTNKGVYVSYRQILEI